MGGSTEHSLEREHAQVEVKREYEGGETSGQMYPRRSLNNFVLEACGELCSLESIATCKFTVKGTGTWHAREDGSESPRPISNVSLDAVLEFAFEYDHVATGVSTRKTQPTAWIRSQHAWFRLMRPASQYQAVFQSTWDKIKLVARLIDVLEGSSRMQPVKEVLQQLSAADYVTLSQHCEFVHSEVEQCLETAASNASVTAAAHSNAAHCPFLDMVGEALLSAPHDVARPGWWAALSLSRGESDMGGPSGGAGGGKTAKAAVTPGGKAASVKRKRLDDTVDDTSTAAVPLGGSRGGGGAGGGGGGGGSHKFFEVDTLVGRRQLKDGTLQYKVHWLGYGSAVDTWESVSNLKGFENEMSGYDAGGRSASGLGRGGGGGEGKDVALARGVDEKEETKQRATGTKPDKHGTAGSKSDYPKSHPTPPPLSNAEEAVISTLAVSSLPPVVTINSEVFLEQQAGWALPTVGARVATWWPRERAWFAGTLQPAPDETAHMNNGQEEEETGQQMSAPSPVFFLLRYDDGDSEVVGPLPNVHMRVKIEQAATAPAATLQRGGSGKAAVVHNGAAASSAHHQTQINGWLAGGDERHRQRLPSEASGRPQDKGEVGGRSHNDAPAAVAAAPLLKPSSFVGKNSQAELTWLQARTDEHASVDSLAEAAACLVGCQLSVWWRAERHCFRGTLTKFNSRKFTFMIDYEDGDKELLHFPCPGASLLNDQTHYSAEQRSAFKRIQRDVLATKTIGLPVKESVPEAFELGSAVAAYWRQEGLWYEGRVSNEVTELVGQQSKSAKKSKPGSSVNQTRTVYTVTYLDGDIEEFTLPDPSVVLLDKAKAISLRRAAEEQHGHGKASVHGKSASVMKPALVVKPGLQREKVKPAEMVKRAVSKSQVRPKQPPVPKSTSHPASRTALTGHRKAAIVSNRGSGKASSAPSKAPAAAAAGSKPLKTKKVSKGDAGKKAISHLSKLGPMAGAISHKQPKRPPSLKKASVSSSARGHAASEGGKKKQQQGKVKKAKVVVDWAECALCKKWRRLPSHVKSSALPALWSCSHVPGGTCQIPEEPFNVEKEQEIKLIGKSKSKTKTKKGSTGIAKKSRTPLKPSAGPAGGESCSAFPLAVMQAYETHESLFDEDSVDLEGSPIGSPIRESL